MNTEQRLKVLEEEFKILKNEVKTILLDLREQYLNIQNPFNYNMTPNSSGTALGTNPDQQDETKEPEKEPDKAKLNSILDPKASNPIPENKPVVEEKQEEALPTLPELPPLSDAPVLSAESEFDAPGLNSGNPFLEAPGFGGGDDMSEMGQGSSTEDDDEDIEDEPETKTPQNRKKIPKNGTEKEKVKDLELNVGGGRFDLVIIAGLSQWVDQAAAKLGKERAEALVEMSCTMGRIPENLKDVLIKMARLSRHESNGQMATATDYLALLAQLENLLGGSEIQDKALLSILSMMKGNGNG